MKLSISSTPLLLLTTLLHSIADSYAFFSIDASPKSKATSSPVSKSPMFEYLKFDSNPKFDVLKKTKDYVNYVAENNGADDAFFDKDYG